MMGVVENHTKHSENLMEQELIEEMNMTSQRILLIDLLLKISEFLDNLVIENAVNIDRD